MTDEIWVLGATGRSGRMIAARLAAAGMPTVLVGRDSARLQEVAGTLDGDVRTRPAASVDAVIAELGRSTPAVVVNTIGPFSGTAVPVARACLPGTHYVDLANELSAVAGLLELHAEAVDAGRTLVAGAGFGVLATESVLLRLCAGEPAPARVRVDAVPSVATEPGRVGPALAASILGAAAAGGRQVEQGALTRAPLGAAPERLTTPDGDVVITGSAPTAELLAAWRGSGAPSVLAASSVAPTGAAVRLLLPVVSAVLGVPAVAGFATRRLAGLRLRDLPMPRRHSWAHARVEWPSGDVREGWLRVGDGSDFTAAVATEVALRLARGAGRPGAYTPGALFGPDLAVSAGGQFVPDAIDQRPGTAAAG